MTNQRLPYLLSQYLSKSCSAAELREFYSLVGDLTNERELQDLLDAAYSTTLTEQQLEDTTQEKMIRSILQQAIDQSVTIDSELTMSARLPILERRRGLLSRIAVAASIAVTIGISIYFFKASRYPDAGWDQESAQYASDIRPGKNTAILILASGKVINLSDTKTGIVINASSLRYNDNTFVIQSESEGSGSLGIGDDKETQDDKGTRNDVAREDRKVQMLTASTPRGGTYQICMADGTRVWLNAASSIKFPSTFSGLTNRKVELVGGEAYFEVAKNKRMPFIVVSNGQQVEVLGTHFNITAYNDEASTKTTLLEGSVKVSTVQLDGRHPDFFSSIDDANRSSRGLKPFSSGSRNRKTIIQGKEVILLPNQEATVRSGSAIAIKEVDPELAVAWKKGFFNFKNTDLETVMRQVERWYDVDVIYTDQELKKETISGTVSRYGNVSGVLRILELTGVVKFKIENKTIRISK